MKDQRTIEELRSTVAGRDMAIDEKNLQIAELRSDVVQMGNAISFKNVRLKNKQAVINGLKEQINRLESTYDSMHSAMLEDNQAIMKDLKACQRNECASKAELSVRKQDSKVLMQVVEAIQLYQDDRHGAVSTVIAIKCLLVDYLDVPGVPGILTLQTPSIDHQAEMSAVKNLLNEPSKDLRMAAGDMLDKFNDRAHKAELYKKEINRLRRILGTADKEINELSSRYCDRCDQLEEIKKIIMEK
jgi:chromosome segregation ATPase